MTSRILLRIAMVIAWVWPTLFAVLANAFQSLALAVTEVASIPILIVLCWVAERMHRREIRTAPWPEMDALIARLKAHRPNGGDERE